ncbi:MAG: hypothetical protein HYV36_05420, partial [Lentisphaerae bacterium]|nr:hypothetical protein [Lentisphaerota bacterium]
AASVIAKVTRDRWMTDLDRAHPQYGFVRHKGYGTAAHIQALLKYGPISQHRRTFRPVRDMETIRSRLNHATTWTPCAGTRPTGMAQNSSGKATAQDCCRPGDLTGRRLAGR